MRYRKIQLNKDLAFPLILGIILTTFLVRFFALGNYPKSLYGDEVSIGYEAYSILKTGRDTFGNFLPFSFRSYEDFKLPSYIYATSISEFLFGRNAFAVRFPSALFGTLTIITFITLLLLLTRNKLLSFLGGLFLATSAWHTHFSRAAFESNMSLFFILAGTFLILHGLNKNSRVLFLGLFFYILSLYTYHSPRIFIPFFLLFLFVMYKRKFLSFWQKYKKATLVVGIMYIIALLPYFQYAFSPGGLIRARSESFMRDVKITSSTPFYESIYKAGNRLLENYFSYFSLEFLFFHGDYNGRHSVREIGMLYLWQMPFLLYGIYKGIKEKREEDLLFISWLLIAPVAGALASPNPHALRGLNMVLPLLYFISRGFVVFLNRYRSLHFSLFCTFLFVYFFYQYLHIYYIHYPKRSGPDWSDGYRETADYIRTHENDYSKVVITANFSKAYMYLFFYGNFDPNQVQKYKNPNESFDKYLFVRNSYTNTSDEKILYVAREIETPLGKHLETIRNSGNDIVFEIWEI